MEQNELEFIPIMQNVIHILAEVFELWVGDVVITSHEIPVCCCRHESVLVAPRTLDRQFLHTRFVYAWDDGDAVE